MKTIKKKEKWYETNWILSTITGTALILMSLNPQYDFIFFRYLGVFFLGIAFGDFK